MSEEATERQRKRIAKLGIGCDAASLTHVEAARLIKEAEAELPATKAQREKAAELNVSVPEAATRGALEEMIDAAKRSSAIKALRRKKIAIADDATWEQIEHAEEVAKEEPDSKKLAASLRRKGVKVTDEMRLDDLQELASARKDLENAMYEARKAGFVYVPPEDLSIAEMERVWPALADLVQEISGIEVLLDDFRRYGVTRKPRKAAVKAALPDLFDRILADEWKADDDDLAWFFRRALELDPRNETTPSAQVKRRPSGGKAGCTIGIALVALGVSVAFVLA